VKKDAVSVNEITSEAELIAEITRLKAQVPAENTAEPKQKRVLSEKQNEDLACCRATRLEKLKSVLKNK
jgi:hypothetical protein